jgi:hypothetical protein
MQTSIHCKRHDSIRLRPSDYKRYIRELILFEALSFAFAFVLHHGEPIFVDNGISSGVFRRVFDHQ